MAKLFEPDPLQLFICGVVVLAAVTTTSPSSPAVLALIVVNSVLLLALRLTPDDGVANRGTLPLVAAGVLADAALVSLATNGYPAVFALFVVGHAGYTLAPRPAVVVAVTAVGLNVAAVLVPLGVDHTDTPAWSQLFTGVPVFAGMLNRGRTVALRAAREALAQADRAGQAEAREKVLAERGRIARDVHDVLAHSLAAISMQLEMADTLLDVGSPERAQAAVRKAQAIAREGMEQTQRTVFALREGALPLVTTLASMAADVQATFTVVGEGREVGGDVAQALVRVVQESLTNARKHAAGAATSVVLSFLPGATEVETCNARAAAQPTGGGTGMGLVGMRERMAGLGGSLHSGPTPDGGWRVCASVPLVGRPA